MDEEERFDNLKMDLERWMRDFNHTKEKCGWFLDKVSGIDRIINIGCSGGLQTLELCFALGASSAVGIDKYPVDKRRPDPIRDATLSLDDLKEAIEEIQENHQLVQNIEWREQEVLMFFRGLLSDNSPTLDYKHWDITTNQNFLLSNSFDLVYCGNVLYHIWLEEEENKKVSVITEVVQRLKNLVRSGGYLVIDEPFEYASQYIDLERSLLNVGLHILYKDKISYNDNYDYIKTKIDQHIVAQKSSN